MLIFGLLLVISSNATASNQEKGEEARRQRPSFEQFMAEKIRFLVQEMKLNASDSANFVVVYQQLQKEKGDLMRKYHSNREIARRIRSGETMPDSLYLKIVMSDAQLQVEDAQLEKTYLEKLSKVLTAKQLYEYQWAERKFRNSFMQRPNNGFGRQPQKK